MSAPASLCPWLFFAPPTAGMERLQPRPTPAPAGRVARARRVGREAREVRGWAVRASGARASAVRAWAVRALEGPASDRAAPVLPTRARNIFVPSSAPSIDLTARSATAANTPTACAAVFVPAESTHRLASGT